MPVLPDNSDSERVELEALQPIASDAPAIPSMPLVERLPIVITVELGRTTISVKELKNLRKGQILGLDKLIGDSLGIYANGKKLGSGEAVSVSQDRYGVRVMALVEDNDQPDELPP